MELGLTMAILGGALAVVLGGIGSAIGVGLAGQASSGVMSEDPDKFGSLLLLVALPGTQGIYGFLSAFLVILKLAMGVAIFHCLLKTLRMKIIHILYMELMDHRKKVTNSHLADSGLKFQPNGKKIFIFRIKGRSFLKL